MRSVILGGVLTVRAAIAGDVEACAEILRRLPDFFTPDTHDDVRIALDRHRGWVASDEGGVVGFVVVEQQFARSAEITFAAVPGELRTYVATRAFWEHRGLVQIECIDPLPGWQPGNPSAIYVAALSATVSTVSTVSIQNCGSAADRKAGADGSSRAALTGRRKGQR